MSYDLFPMGTLEVKRRLLDQVVDEKALLLFYHDARRPLGTVRREKGRYVFGEVDA
jgi:hypothetical protein